jgi:predicted DNA-binding antitoxin AbrB/MazE fold protein
MVTEQMTMASPIKAIYDHGVFRPKEPVQLEEQTEVDVFVSDRDEAGEDGWQVWKRFAGRWKDAAETDIAENHDKYLHE